MKWIALIIAALLLGCQRGPEGTADGDCADGKDNDFDGQYDCDDDGCMMNDVCVNKSRLTKEQEASPADEAGAKSQGQPAVAPQPYFDVEGLLVQRNQNGSDVNWFEAEQYCRELKLAGKSGWRLPTDEEALKIIRSGSLTGEASYVMWTSTKKGKKRALIVGMTTGAVNDLGVQYRGQCRARCVWGQEK